MKPIRCLILAAAIFLGSSAAWAAGPGCDEAGETAAALLCKQDQCPDLNQANAKGITPDQVYYSYCSSYGIEIRSRIANATLDTVIFELNGTKFPNPPTLIPPCECLAMLKDAFGDCEVEQCRPPEPPKSSQPGSVGNPPAENVKLPALLLQGGCSLQSSGRMTCGNIGTLGLGLLLLGLGRLRGFAAKSR